MGRKEICPDCGAKMAEPASFCPRCGKPTDHASDAERLEFDLAQWRSHVDRSGASGVAANGNGSPPATMTKPAPMPSMIQIPDPAAAVPVEARPRRHIARRPNTPRPESVEPDRVIVLDSADDPFAYNACTVCERTDWILRTTRNEDGTWNYWCIRCSRAFKTVVRLRHGIKPFVAAGSVVGGIIATSLLMR
jgi:ssDNA-binding Zn-finger/Zn-ribbon topoisomerase 1